MATSNAVKIYNYEDSDTLPILTDENDNKLDI